MSSTRNHTDRKIHRLAASWLHPDPASAAWLAGLADEVTTSAPVRLRPGRHSYVVLDAARDVRVVAPGTAALDVSCPTTVLALPTPLMAEAARRIPALTDAWAHALTDDSTTPASPAPTPV